jgi:hypothetical protein
VSGVPSYSLEGSAKFIRRKWYRPRFVAVDWRGHVAKRHGGADGTLAAALTGTSVYKTSLFNRVQNVLEGKKPVTAPHRKDNPDFPLKHLVRCGACGTPLTACFSRSKTASSMGTTTATSRAAGP